MINEIRKLESHHWKQPFSTVSLLQNPTTMQCTGSPPAGRSLQEIFLDLHTLNDRSQRQYRTIATGDDDVHGNLPVTHSVIDQSKRPILSKRKTRRINLENELTKTTVRTICTRSSTLKNHQQQQVNQE